MAGSDFSIWPPTAYANIQQFYANSNVVGGNWQPWYRPNGCTMLNILLIGCGGGGGNAVAGAASTAGGGGGGGSGAQTTLTIPLALLPETLFISVARGNGSNASTSVAASFASYVTISPGNVAAPAANNVVAIANGGASGGAATGATAGPAGTAGAIAASTSMPFGWAFAKLSLVGQAGIIGGAAVAGAALTLPTTGLLVTGGTGGGGLGAANVAGKAGGLIRGVAGFLVVPVSIPGGVGGTVTPTAGGDGVAGSKPHRDIFYFVGGTGGGSCGLSATPTGANGGNGAPGGLGCGAGGGGAAFTGNTPGNGGRGGDAFCIMTAW